MKVTIDQKSREQMAKLLHKTGFGLGVRRGMKRWRDMFGSERGVYEIMVSTVIENIDINIDVRTA